MKLLFKAFLRVLILGTLELYVPESCQEGFPGGASGKESNLSASAGDIRDMGSIPGLERSPGGGHGSTLQYSCLKNSMPRRL